MSNQDGWTVTDVMSPQWEDANDWTTEPAECEQPAEPWSPSKAVRERIARICRDAGLAVEASDIVKPDPNIPAYTIDGMPWKEWFEAMTEQQPNEGE